MSSPRARSRNSARAVRKMIGIPVVRSSFSNCSATRQPSSPGIITSSRITSGPSSRAFSTPDGPSAASMTAMPSASRLTRQSSRIGASSSITRTFVIPGRSARIPAASTAYSRAAGSSNAKLEPCPSVESTQMRPPIAFTSSFAMNSPRPVPAAPSRAADSAR